MRTASRAELSVAMGSVSLLLPVDAHLDAVEDGVEPVQERVPVGQRGPLRAPGEPVKPGKGTLVDHLAQQVDVTKRRLLRPLPPPLRAALVVRAALVARGGRG